jgi:hypothetical protein
MSAARVFTRDELLEALTEALEPVSGATAVINRWLERGDGVGIYQNQELGSDQAGHRQYVSFGSPAAQLIEDPPPQRLPDIGGSINWRYQLEGIYRGEAL